MKSELAIRRELNRVERKKNAAATEQDGRLAFGAEQALAWVLGGYASPSKLVEKLPWPAGSNDIGRLTSTLIAERYATELPKKTD